MPGEPMPGEDVSDSDEEREDDYLDDCDLISSEDSGSDDSSDDYDEDDEGKARRPDLFPDPLSLIDHAADLNSVLKAKSIGDAIQILCPNLPGTITSIQFSLQRSQVASLRLKMIAYCLNTRCPIIHHDLLTFLCHFMK